MFKFLQRNKVEGGMQYWCDIHGGEYYIVLRGGEPAESNLIVGGLVYGQMLDYLRDGGYL